MPAHVEDAEDSNELKKLDGLQEGGGVEQCFVRCIGDQRSKDIGEDGDDG